MASLVALVGRDREQTQVHECASAAAAGSGTLVLLGGEAGVGKSSLITDLLSERLVFATIIGYCSGPGETADAMPPPFGSAGGEASGRS